MSDKNFIDEQTKTAIQRVIFSYKDKRERVFEKKNISEEQFKIEMSGLRKKVYGNWDQVIGKTIAKLKENGVFVYEAKNQAAVLRHLKEIIKTGNRIVKSKSNTVRELGLEKFLEQYALENNLSYADIETDLGDYLVALFHSEDMHYVLPALHLSPEKISEKIFELFGERIAADPQALTRYLCDKIRNNILRADIGITGANFITSTGQILLLENEGNISLITRAPKVHIVVAGIDKIVETLEDGMALCQTAAIFGTGQDITQYISVISGPSKTADIQNELVLGAQGAREVHLILVDNGRRAMLEQGFGDLLRCINCGACINYCPVYHNLGVRYGGAYLGAKGIVAAMFLGKCDEEAVEESGADVLLKRALQSGSFECTLCGNCTQNCPMKIDLAGMIRRIRKIQQGKQLQTTQNLIMAENIKQTGNPFGQKDDKTTPDALYCC